MEGADRQGTTSGGTGSQDPSAGTESNEGEVTYGGGFQPGGGMVEPDEFIVGEDEGLPNDALAEGLGNRPRPEDVGTVDPKASPPANDTGARIGDVSGYQGSDQVVGLDPSVTGDEGQQER